MFTCEKCKKNFRKEALYNSHLSKNCSKTPSKENNDQNIKAFCNNEEIQVKPEIKEINISEKINKKPNLPSEQSEKIDEPKKTIRRKSPSIDLTEIQTRLFNLEEKTDLIIQLLEELKVSKMSNEEIGNNILCVKKEKIKIKMEETEIVEYLNQKSIEMDAELLYNYYLRDTEHKYYSIKKLKANEYTFLGEAGWQIDKNGNELKNILSHNLKKLYTRINRFEIIQNNDEVLKNQEYINNLLDKKYQTLLLETFSEKYLD